MRSMPSGSHRSVHQRAGAVVVPAAERQLELGHADVLLVNRTVEMHLLRRHLRLEQHFPHRIGHRRRAGEVDLA